MNPRRIYADLTVFARGYLRNQVALFFSLAFPVILVLLFGLIFNQPTATVTLYAVNFDHGGNASTQFLSALNETGAVNVVVLGPAQLPNNESLATYLSDNSDPVGIVIPAGFTSDYVTHQPTIVTLYSNPEDQVSGGIAEAAVEGVSNQFNLQLSNGSPVIGVDVEPLASTIYKEIDYLVPGLIGFSILTSPMFAMVDISSTYKKDHLFRQLSLTPLQKDEWLTAKIIWYVILSMVSAVLMVGIGLVAFHAHVSLSLGMLPFLVLGPFFFVSLGMLAGPGVAATTVPITRWWSATGIVRSTRHSRVARAPSRSATPVTPRWTARPENFSSEGIALANRSLIARSATVSTLTPNTPARSMIGVESAVSESETSRVGGRRATEMSEFTVRPTSTPPPSRPVTMATPLAQSAMVRRNDSGSMGAFGSVMRSLLVAPLERQDGHHEHHHGGDR